MAAPSTGTSLEQVIPIVQEQGLNTNKNTNLGGTLNVQGTSTFVGLASITGGLNITGATVRTFAPVAANATATLTAAQVAAGYITSTSAAATTLTLPTGTLLGAAVGAVRGTILELYIDNTAGASTVTMAVATNGILSDAAVTTAASFGQLTVAANATGVARFTIMFSSATAYVFTRTA